MGCKDRVRIKGVSLCLADGHIFSSLVSMNFFFFLIPLSISVLEGGTDWKGCIGAGIRRGFNVPPWISSSIMILRSLVVSFYLFLRWERERNNVLVATLLLCILNMIYMHVKDSYRDVVLTWGKWKCCLCTLRWKKKDRQWSCTRETGRRFLLSTVSD